MIKLYNVPISGNCHKIRLLLSFLALPYQLQNIDLTRGEQKSDNFLKLNPFGQVPVLDDAGVVIRDSQAILVYLAKQYTAIEWYPEGAEALAQINSWLATAANEITYGPARLRAHHKFGRHIEIKHATETTNHVLDVINSQLSHKHWLVGEHVTIADIAIYPYLALAHEGLISLKPYPSVLNWLKRFESLPGYISMPGIHTQ